jgi:glutamine synthetase
VVLARLLIGRIARRHGLRAWFSPLPFAGGGGNAAYPFLVHPRRPPLFSGGPGPYGITDEGGGAIGGLVAALPGVQAVLGGSILSGARLRPGFWSGDFA